MAFRTELLCLTILSIWAPMIAGHFNLYLNLNEVKRILGLSKELYYVTEGVVNEYALNFVVPVPPDINALHFTWQSLGLKPLPYTSSIEISDSLAIRKPTLNISSKGYIPTVPQTFQILLPCSGAKTNEVYMELTLNVTIPPPLIDGKVLAATSTSVVIKRKIFCYEDPNFSSKQRGMTLDHTAAAAAQPNSNQQSKSKGLKSKTSNGGGSGNGKSNGNGNGNSSSNNNNNNGVINGNGGADDEDERSQNTRRKELLVIPTEQAVGDNSNMIYIIMGSSLGLIIILIALASGAIAYVRTRKVANTAESSGFLHIETSGNGSSGSGSGTGSGGSLFLRSESPHHYAAVSPCHDLGPYSYSSFNSPNNNPNAFYTEISTCTKSRVSENSSGTIESNCKLAEMMTIARCKVRLQSVIMEGTFARVYNGTVLERLGSEKKVIVKTVVDHSSPVQMALLLHEGLSLVGMLQQHVLTVIGVAAEERVPPFLIYSDDGFRNCKRFLQRCRSGPGRPITAQEIVHMAIQIASGIAFLHRQNVVHRDIATRNCVVDDKLIVKVSDSALSKDLFPEDYQWMGEAESRPVKWMPPESIIENRTSLAADMWSFGVLLWELTTFAQQPYADIDVNELNSFLTMGYRLSQPMNCPDELYSSMTRCWTWDPEDRPKWTQVLPELQDLHAQLAQYV